VTPRFTIFLKDTFDWLKSLPDASVDLIVTDPAYISLEKHRAKGTTTRLKVSDGSSNEWFAVIGNDRLPELMRECYRVLRNDRHCYVFTDPETLFHLKPAAEEAGFEFRRIIVWDKVLIGMGYGYRRRTEFVLFLLKGKRRVADLGISDLLTCKRVSNGYPTEKPVELLEIFIKQSAQPGELVIDPFLGSGSTGVAALRNGCRFAGCDISPKSIATAMPRLVAEDEPRFDMAGVEALSDSVVEALLADNAPRPPRVWNLKLSAEIPGGAVFVCRPSKWGNPIHLQSERGRESVLQRYEEWLMTQPELIAAARTELRGKDLVCHCAPKPCHADILMRIANEPETEEEIEQRMRLTEPLDGRCACDGTGECSWCERGVAFMTEQKSP
jgi:site-specific DNA-methyltransferase (adenine-specific)